METDVNMCFYHYFFFNRQRFINTTCVEFEPEDYKQMAGLVCLCDHVNFYYLRISCDPELGGKSLGIWSCDNNVFSYPLKKDIPISDWKRCYLRVKVDYDRMQFYYSQDETEWRPAGPVLDASRLSDDYCREGKFTGAFVGDCAVRI
jgi:xylan 1,4-beta-xylosidase